MGIEAWLSDIDLGDAHLRCLLAVEEWNRSHPGRRPTNEQVAALCGWHNDGVAAEDKAKRILRDLERMGMIDRGTGEKGGGARHPIAINPGRESRRLAMVALLDPEPVIGEPCTDAPCSLAPIENVHTNAAFKTERPVAADGQPCTAKISADALLDDLMGLLGRVVAEAGTLDMSGAEAYATRLDLLLGFGYGEGIGRNYTARNRRRLYLHLLQALANGLGLALVRLQLRTTLDRFQRQYDINRDAFDRPLMFRVLHESRIEPAAWCAKRRRNAGKGGVVPYRQILPAEMHRYALPAYGSVQGL